MKYKYKILIYGLIMYISLIPRVKSQIGLINLGNIHVENNALMHIQGNAVFRDSSSIILNGEMYLTGDFINQVTRGKVFDPISNGTFGFIGDQKQNIGGNALRDTNYIAFPNVVVNKDAQYVAMEPNMGADIKNLTLTKGKFSLQAESLLEDIDVAYHNSFYPYTTGHLRVNQVNYNHDPSAQGVVEVEVGLSSAVAVSSNKIIGFSSPYKAMYTDYLLGNYLASPSEKGLWGEDTVSIKNPENKLVAGKGYLVGQEIMPQYPIRYAYDPVWGDISDFEQAKAKEKIVLNRYNFEAENVAFANMVTQADKYSIEELNTSDLVVSLKKGWQFIGNPFTSPLDLSLLLQTANNTNDAWKIERGLNGTKGISARYFVPSGGTGALDNWTPDRFTLNPMWLVGQAVGSTVSREANDQFLLAPMQMIAVYANEDIDITIPASERVHGASKQNYPITDELLLEVSSDYSFDRLTVVFRPDASVNAIDPYDVVKTVDSLASPAQIFTISEDGYALISNILPTTATHVEVGLIPTLNGGMVTITPYRLSSLQSVNEIWLYDRIEDYWLNIQPGVYYNAVSNPGDRIDRFVLYFNVPKGSLNVEGKKLSPNLFSYNSKPGTLPAIHSATKIAAGSTGPVGSIYTDVLTEMFSGKFCENTDPKSTISGTIENMVYSFYNEINGDMKMQFLGYGAVLPSPQSMVFLTGEIFGKDSPKYWYALADYQGDEPAIRRWLPLSFDSMIQKKVYPDLRVTSCLGDQNINLNKYIDVENLVSVEWKKVSGKGVLANNFFTSSGNEKNTLAFTYTVTNECEEGNTAKFYLTQARNRSNPIPDTVVFCMQTTKSIQLNAVFGMNVPNEEIVPVTLGLESYIHRAQAPLVYEGAFIFDAQQAFSTDSLLPDAPTQYGNGAKQAIFRYKSSAESCYAGKEFDLVIILTK